MNVHPARLLFDCEYSKNNYQLWVTTIRWAPFNELLLLAYSQKYLVVFLRDSSATKPLKVKWMEFENILNAEFVVFNCKSKLCVHVDVCVLAGKDLSVHVIDWDSRNYMEVAKVAPFSDSLIHQYSSTQHRVFPCGAYVNEASIIVEQREHLITVTESELKLWDAKGAMAELSALATASKNLKKLAYLEVARGILAVLETEEKKLYLYQARKVANNYALVLICVKDIYLPKEVSGLAITVEDYKKDQIEATVLVIDSGGLRVYPLTVKVQETSTNLQATASQIIEKPKPPINKSSPNPAAKPHKENSKKKHKPLFKLKRKKPESSILSYKDLSSFDQVLYNHIEMCGAQMAKLDSIVLCGLR